MKTLRPCISPVISVFVFFLFPPLLFADFNSGKQAFDSGDYRTAFSEWKTSADRGDAASQYELGKLYEEGLGVPEDYVLGHVYFNLAASQGHSKAREAKKTIAKKMTPAELADARGLARRWQPAQENPQMAQPAPQHVPAPQAPAAPPPSPAIENTQAGLFKASKEGKVDVVKQILSSGVDVNARDSKGRTALMIAAFHGNKNVVETLIEAKAEIYAKSKKGVTAQVLAEKKGFDEIAKLLIPPAPEGMVLIPAGEFWMGEENPYEDVNQMKNQLKKAHLTEYYIDIYEVSGEESLKVFSRNRAGIPFNYNNIYSNINVNKLPVRVSLNQAKEYCRSKGKRLPTEEEWEKAAKGGTRTKYYWGNEMESGKANFCDRKCPDMFKEKTKYGKDPYFEMDLKSYELDDGYEELSPVGSFPLNPYGLYDTAGNESEYVSNGKDLGGTWAHKASRVRPSFRSTQRMGASGFRCAKDAP
jgi:formylglycine-generating enzyme required for sulfatase activity